MRIIIIPSSFFLFFPLDQFYSSFLCLVFSMNNDKFDYSSGFHKSVYCYISTQRRQCNCFCRSDSRCIYTLKDLGHFSIQCFLNGFKQRYPRRIRLKKRYPRRIRLKKRYPRRIRLKNECSYPGFIFIGGRTQSLALLSFYLNNYRLSLNSLCGYPSFTFYIQFLESYKNFFYYFVLSGPNS